VLDAGAGGSQADRVGKQRADARVGGGRLQPFDGGLALEVRLRAIDHLDLLDGPALALQVERLGLAAGADFVTYRDVVGLEVRLDVPIDGGRWLTLGVPDQPDIQIIIEPTKIGESLEDQQTLESLMASESGTALDRRRPDNEPPTDAKKAADNPGERWGGYPARPAKQWLREVATLARLTRQKRMGDGQDGK